MNTKTKATTTTAKDAAAATDGTGKSQSPLAEGLLTAVETMAALGISRSELQRMVSRGDLLQVRLHDRGRARYRARQIEELVRKRIAIAEGRASRRRKPKNRG